eukprot:CAMPEP_0179149120 /NCGR_PEP_ID=MMETSP0796-20121207/72218_1 /TAXON_ID=73915 /ORGANISM="Pyrodinium bahamense, Strain pbaha01" /LENGTH=39 /DNA_ID= /DNA_START= /DNA_END= /DNA_ORIENTATION=
MVGTIKSMDTVLSQFTPPWFVASTCSDIAGTAEKSSHMN